jgi:hypothetical protein
MAAPWHAKPFSVDKSQNYPVSGLYGLWQAREFARTRRFIDNQSR